MIGIKDFFTNLNVTVELHFMFQGFIVEVKKLVNTFFVDGIDKENSCFHVERMPLLQQFFMVYNNNLVIPIFYLGGEVKYLLKPIHKSPNISIFDGRGTVIHVNKITKHARCSYRLLVFSTCG